jgi:hypothetical protein
MQPNSKFGGSLGIRLFLPDLGRRTIYHQVAIDSADVAWHGMAWRGVAWHGVAIYHQVEIDNTDMAWRGMALRGVAWHAAY